MGHPTPAAIRQKMRKKKAEGYTLNERETMDMITLCGHELDPPRSNYPEGEVCNRQGCCFPKSVVLEAIKKMTHTTCNQKSTKTDAQVLLFTRMEEFSCPETGSDVGRATNKEAMQGGQSHNGLPAEIVQRDQSGTKYYEPGRKAKDGKHKTIAKHVFRGIKLTGKLKKEAVVLMNKKNAQLLLLPEDIIMEGHSMHLDQIPHNLNNITPDLINITPDLNNITSLDNLENIINQDFEPAKLFADVLPPPVLGSVPHYQDAMEELDQASTTSTQDIKEFDDFDINKFLADGTPDRDGLSPEAGA